MHDNFGLRYVNCGDWVESCTAIAEHHDGRFEIIHWTETPRLRQATAGEAAARAA
jgi:UDP-2,3-diacylglucosamine pyrophosphatase LpxH